MIELRINGYGGQGAVTLAHMLAHAALENGEQGQALPFFGVERRGAPVRAAVRISPTTIYAHSQCDLPDCVVIMSAKLIEEALKEGIKVPGTVIVNAPHPVTVKGHTTWQVDADAIARETGLVSADGLFINVPMFGAVCRVLNIPENIMRQTILKNWPGKKGETNLQAAQRAYQLVTQIN